MTLYVGNSNGTSLFRDGQGLCYSGLGRQRCGQRRQGCQDPHPVLRAHAQAATVKLDVNENIRPVKDRNTGRIDGIVALIMAISRAIAHKEFHSIYETRGVLRL